MNLFSTIRKPGAFAALALTLVLSGAIFSSGRGARAHGVNEATANLRYSTEITYYSDASHTTEVGWRYIRCNGSATTTGTVTQYYTSEIIDVCCGTVPC